MATISSLGIGSGLDSESIVTKLAALEKQPLVALQSKATFKQTQISEFGKIQSQFSALADAALAMSTAASWTARKASSSNVNAATIAVTSTANATSFSLDIDSLAKSQSLTAMAVPRGSAVGAGSMNIRIGSWSGSADAKTAADAAAVAAAGVSAAAQAAFVGGSSEASDYASANTAWLAAQAANTPVVTDQAAEDAALADRDAAYNLLSAADLGRLATADSAAAALAAANAAALAAQPAFSPAGTGLGISINVTAADTLTTLANKINAANGGVLATVFNDGTQDRLLVSSKDTGVAAGFRIETTEVDGTNADNTGLSRFAFNPAAGAFGMATAGLPVQLGENAKARINGIEVTSGSNTLTGNLPGVTINLVATTTTNYNGVGGAEVRSPVTISISEDVTVAVKNISAFTDAYNALAKNLADLTKFDAATKTAGVFQADSSILSLQSLLRNVASSVSVGGAYSRLVDVGVVRQLDGSLLVNTGKLSVAANNGTELQKLFITDNKNSSTNGFALKFKELAQGLIGSSGSVTGKAKALQKELSTNAVEQTRVNDRAAATEARLRKQYSALDTKMAGLTALNAYVAQQVATWNKSTG